MRLAGTISSRSSGENLGAIGAIFRKAPRRVIILPGPPPIGEEEEEQETATQTAAETTKEKKAEPAERPEPVQADASGVRQRHSHSLTRSICWARASRSG